MLKEKLMSQNGFAQISLFGKMQRGRSPSFKLFQLDMYSENGGKKDNLLFNSMLKLGLDGDARYIFIIIKSVQLGNMTVQLVHSQCS